ncbi:MAG: flagellar hook-length control protein FliK, partial [Oscillospiraceae bacterium]|nr:flagellar hook-length control protein FliK [Oscillospiraceae bacterium]
PGYGAPAPDGGEIMIPEASQYSVSEPRTRIKTASGEAPPTERTSAPAGRTPPPAEASRAPEPRGTSAAARPDSATIRDIELREPPALVHTHIPLKIRGERREAELYVRRGGKGGKNRGEPSSGDADMLLSLELPSLGKWEALVTVSGRDMSVRMKTESDGARALLASNTDKLAEILSGAGYRLSSSRVVLFGEESAAAAPPRAQPARYVDMSI